MLPVPDALTLPDPATAAEPLLTALFLEMLLPEAPAEGLRAACDTDDRVEAPVLATEPLVAAETADLDAEVAEAPLLCLVIDELLVPALLEDEPMPPLDEVPVMIPFLGA